MDILVPRFYPLGDRHVVSLRLRLLCLSTRYYYYTTFLVEYQIYWFTKIPQAKAWDLGGKSDKKRRGLDRAYKK